MNVEGAKARAPWRDSTPHRHGRHIAQPHAATSRQKAHCAGTGAVGTPAVRVRIKGDESESPQLAQRTCRFRAGAACLLEPQQQPDLASRTATPVEKIGTCHPAHHHRRSICPSAPRAREKGSVGAIPRDPQHAPARTRAQHLPNDRRQGFGRTRYRHIARDESCRCETGGGAIRARRIEHDHRQGNGLRQPHDLECTPQRGSCDSPANWSLIFESEIDSGTIGTERTDSHAGCFRRGGVHVIPSYSDAARMSLVPASHPYTPDTRGSAAPMQSPAIMVCVPPLDR
jgi:hypothetical protein